MNDLQGNTSGTTVANPQTLAQTSLLSNNDNIQSTATTQSDLYGVSGIQQPPPCQENCVAAVTSHVPKTSGRLSATDMLGGGLLLAGILIVSVFAKRVLNS
jgi:hypothetical protein